MLLGICYYSPFTTKVLSLYISLHTESTKECKGKCCITLFGPCILKSHYFALYFNFSQKVYNISVWITNYVNTRFTLGVQYIFVK